MQSTYQTKYQNPLAETQGDNRSLHQSDIGLFVKKIGKSIGLATASITMLMQTSCATWSDYAQHNERQEFSHYECARGRPIFVTEYDFAPVQTIILAPFVFHKKGAPKRALRKLQNAKEGARIVEKGGSYWELNDRYSSDQRFSALGMSSWEWLYHTPDGTRSSENQDHLWGRRWEKNDPELVDLLLEGATFQPAKH